MAGQERTRLLGGDALVDIVESDDGLHEPSLRVDHGMADQSAPARLSPDIDVSAALDNLASAKGYLHIIEPTRPSQRMTPADALRRRRATTEESLVRRIHPGDTQALRRRGERDHGSIGAQVAQFEDGVAGCSRHRRSGDQTFVVYRQEWSELEMGAERQVVHTCPRHSGSSLYQTVPILCASYQALPLGPKNRMSGMRAHPPATAIYASPDPDAR